MTEPVAAQEVPEIRQAVDILAEKMSTDSARDTLVSLVPEGVEIAVEK